MVTARRKACGTRVCEISLHAIVRGHGPPETAIIGRHGPPGAAVEIMRKGGMAATLGGARKMRDASPDERKEMREAMREKMRSDATDGATKMQNKLASHDDMSGAAAPSGLGQSLVVLERYCALAEMLASSAATRSAIDMSWPIAAVNWWLAPASSSSWPSSRRKYTIISRWSSAAAIAPVSTSASTCRSTPLAPSR